MSEYRIDFESPAYLWLLLLAPLMWWLSFRSLAGLGMFRRLLALALRTGMLALLVLALAQVQWVQISDKVTVIYLLDQSRSIPPPQRLHMVEYVNSAIREHREHDDRAGVIVFGRDAAIEFPAFADNPPLQTTIESLLDENYTNLAGAMKLAQAVFPADSARRIVIVSDGNENLGDALEQAQSLAEGGIGIDVRPVRYETLGEVIMEKVTLPSDVREGQPFDVRIVLNNTTVPTEDHTGEVRGTLKVFRRAGDIDTPLTEQEITLPPGKRVYTVREPGLDVPEFYTYRADFTPEDPAFDAIEQNNHASSFTHIRGKRQVLLIENSQAAGEHAFFIERLKANKIEVTLRSSDQAFTNLAELQLFDAVILADVPREDFSDEQVEMLVRNAEFLGSGLVMLGGPNSFGAGGWANTELEKAMPVEFQIKSAKVVPKGALALLMHASELANGNYWQKIIGQEALKALGNKDYCGVLHWNGNEQWLWKGGDGQGMIPVEKNRDRMMARMDQMTPGDMPDFDPTMIMARQGFAKLDKEVAVKHMIIISDGDPVPASASVLQGLKDNNVTVSTVAVGTHGPAGHNELKRIANATGGKYYVVTNNKALPRIFQLEARKVARPLVYENANGMVPSVETPSHEILRGIEGGLPPITGYVHTTKKSGPLVEIVLTSPLPTGADENNTVLAAWTYGLGRTVAFTTDTGTRYATAWPAWENYDKFFSQMIEWSMRPAGEEGKFSVAADVEDEQVKIVVTALDKEDRFLNFLDMNVTAVGPDMEPRELRLEQTAPGRYVGAFDAREAGSYLVLVNPGGGQAPIRTGVDVPYSPEFRDRQTDEALLTALAGLKTEGGETGQLIEDPNPQGDPQRTMVRLLEINSFRRDLPQASSSQDVWHTLLLLAALLFFFDVFVRRVTVGFEWLPPLAARARDKLLGRQAQPAAAPHMERLRQRKAEVTERIEQQRASARFEPQADAPASSATLDQPNVAAPAEARPAGGAAGLTPDKQEENYTSRLLKAKKRVWDERKPE